MADKVVVGISVLYSCQAKRIVGMVEAHKSLKVFFTPCHSSRFSVYDLDDSTPFTPPSRAEAKPPREDKENNRPEVCVGFRF